MMRRYPDEAGIAVLWKDVGNKAATHDFVPGDPRRSLAGEGGPTTRTVIESGIY